MIRERGRAAADAVRGVARYIFSKNSRPSAVVKGADGTGVDGFFF